MITELQDGLDIEYTTNRVRDAMAALPAAQRLALELAYFKGHTYRQVAVVLGIPEGTKGRLPKGKQSRAGLDAEVIEDLGETEIGRAHV